MTTWTNHLFIHLLPSCYLPHLILLGSVIPVCNSRIEPSLSLSHLLASLLAFMGQCFICVDSGTKCIMSCFYRAKRAFTEDALQMYHIISIFQTKLIVQSTLLNLHHPLSNQCPQYKTQGTIPLSSISPPQSNAGLDSKFFTAKLLPHPHALSLCGFPTTANELRIISWT